MLNQNKPPLPSTMKAPQKPAPAANDAAAAAAATDQPSEKTLSQVQDLLFGNMRQELSDRVEFLGDQFGDFEQHVRAEFRRLADDLRAAERRQEDQRRAAMKDIAAAMELMSQNVRRLAE